MLSSYTKGEEGMCDPYICYAMHFTKTTRAGLKGVR